MAEPSIFLEVNVVFDDLSPTVECMRHLATQLSRTDALIWCARANLIVSNPFNTDEAAHTYLLQTFFPEQPELMRAIGWLHENSSRRARAFFRAQFLELAYWIAKFSRDLPDDGHSFENAGARRVFGQAALVASGLWSNRVNRVMAAPDADIRQLRQRVMADVRKSLDENSAGTQSYVAIGRGSLLWSKYVPKEWRDARRVFEAALGLTPDEYFRSFAAVITQHIDTRPSKLTDHAGSAGLFMASVWDQSQTMSQQFRKVLDGLTMPIDALIQLARSDDHDGFLRQIRRRPILSAARGRLVVFDPTFLVSHAVVGPLFAINAARQDYQCSTYFGNAFEAYVADVVTARYPNTEGLVPRFCCREKLYRGRDIVGDVDAAILTGHRQVCVIETKAVFIADSAVQGIESYHAVIKEKYASGSGKLKGVGQLARIVRELAAGKLTQVPDVLRDAETIFPVLLVHDRLLDSPGHVAFLLEEFVKELQPDEHLPGGRFRKGSLIVTAPIVLTIDDFEWLEASLSNFSLGEFLSEYSAADPERASDVRSFTFHSRFRSMMRGPEAAADAALSVLEDLGLAGFGDEWRKANAGRST